MDLLDRRVPLPKLLDLLIAQDQSHRLGLLAAVAPLLAEGAPIGTQTLDRAHLRAVGVRAELFAFDHDVFAERPEGFAGGDAGFPAFLADGEDGGGICGRGGGGGEGVSISEGGEGGFSFVVAVQVGGEVSFWVEGDGSEPGGVAGVEIGREVGEGVTLGEVGGGGGGREGEGEEGEEEGGVETHCCG